MVSTDTTNITVTIEGDEDAVLSAAGNLSKMLEYLKEIKEYSTIARNALAILETGEKAHNND